MPLTTRRCSRPRRPHRGCSTDRAHRPARVKTSTKGAADGQDRRHRVHSVDGVIEAPSGTESFEGVGWTDAFSRGPEGDQFKLDETLVADALHLQVYPVIVGAGKRLFTDTSATKRLRLVEARTVGDGVHILIYYERAA